MQWLPWALFSALFAAMTALFGKIGVEQINSDMATFIRAVLIFILVAVIVVLSGGWQSPATIPKRSWIFLVLSGMATGASWLCYYRALKLGPASSVAPIDKMSVLFVAIFAALFLDERLHAHNWLGITLIAIGAALVGFR
jgi:transporter family protein